MRKRRTESSSDGVEVEWVEKTKENLNTAPKTTGTVYTVISGLN